MALHHYSDCPVNNGPAYPAGECTCGGYDPNDKARIADLEAAGFTPSQIIAVPVRRWGGVPGRMSETCEIPRRNRLDLMTAAERAILDAVQAVEAAGADVRLTDAVVLLGEARDCVSDYVDGVKAIRRRVDRTEWRD